MPSSWEINPYLSVGSNIYFVTKSSQSVQKQDWIWCQGLVFSPYLIFSKCFWSLDTIAQIFICSCRITDNWTVWGGKDCFKSSEDSHSTDKFKFTCHCEYDDGQSSPKFGHEKELARLVCTIALQFRKTLQYKLTVQYKPPLEFCPKVRIGNNLELLHR